MNKHLTNLFILSLATTTQINSNPASQQKTNPQETIIIQPQKENLEIKKTNLEKDLQKKEIAYKCKEYSIQQLKNIVTFWKENCPDTDNLYDLDMRKTEKDLKIAEIDLKKLTIDIDDIKKQIKEIETQIKQIQK